jgi:hypothetical protein
MIFGFAGIGLAARRRRRTHHARVGEGAGLADDRQIISASSWRLGA